MDADNKPTCAEVRPITACFVAPQGKEEPDMDHVTEPRSVALRNEQITEKDLAVLAQKAKEMIAKGTTPPAPVNPVREGKRVRVKN